MKNINLTLFLSISFLIFFNDRSAAQYFQQEVNYKINVQLNDVKHELQGFESFEYNNNSPAILAEIYIHIWPNAYKNKNTALSKQILENGSKRVYFADEKDRGYIDSLHFKVNEKDVKWIPDSVYIDYGKIILNTPLNPGEKITVSTPFHVKIPSGKLSRMGHIGQAYSITQWYPKPAVYDQSGWHPLPNLDQGEFYSEFGSFEVSITLPKNYVVGATGDLQNEDELKWMNEKASETFVMSKKKPDMSFPKSSTETKTLVYKQNKVHDFAWFADKRYHILKGSVELPRTKEKVTTWALFTNSKADLWKESIGYINNAIYYYSLWNGDYAYRNCTVVDGTIAAGGGMEYPNITIINEPNNAMLLEDVIIHEVGHNWFYGILGSNEREHAWMDEGINTSNEIRYLMMKYNNDTSKYKNEFGDMGIMGKISGLAKLNANDVSCLEYLFSARKRTDQAIEIHSTRFTTINYGTITYAKTGLGFNYLRSYLGDSLYDACMQEYFNQWKFKHPYPGDLRKIFTDKTDKNLDWFFNDFLKTDKKIDYKISKLQQIYGERLINPALQTYAVNLSNKGTIASPFSVSAITDGQILSSTWYDGFSGKDTLFVSCNHCDQIKIDALGSIPEINRQNNTFRTKGLLRRVEKLSFPFLVHVENPDRTQICWTPLLGWNNYDKAMPGLAIHNLSVTNKKFEYCLAPLYSTRNKGITGLGTISYTVYPAHSALETINLSFSGRRFSYLIDDYRTFEKKITSKNLNYKKFDSALSIKFRNRSARSSWYNSVTIRSLSLWKDEVVYARLADSSYGGQIRNQYTYHNQLILSFSNYRTLDPYNLNVLFEQNQNYFKSSLTFNYTVSYARKNKGLDFRLFLGGFLVNLNNTGTFHLTGTGNTLTGNEDYLYENLYLGRNESSGILSRQFYEQEGGFKIYSAIGRSTKWVGSLNIKSDLPGNIPVRIFADIGMYDPSNRAYQDYKGLTFDAGIELELLKNRLEVYIPFVVSKDIDRFYKTNALKFSDRIRFVFNINAFGPFNIRKAIDNL